MRNSNAPYRKDARGPFDAISPRNEPKTKVPLAGFSELQAIAGGTTVLREATRLDKDLKPSGRTLICRDTADPADLKLDPSKRIFSVVDFFRPDRSTGEPSPVS
ncbi:MAG: hypothetical protein AAF492_04305 [Verrucomicrobiota bacterium]